MKRWSLRARLLALAALVPAFLILAGVGACFPRYPTYPVTPQDDLLTHLEGHWVLRGTFRGAEVTDELDGQWAEGHRQLTFHLVSRDRDGNGKPVRESTWVFGHGRADRQYLCQGTGPAGSAYLDIPSSAIAWRIGDALHFTFGDGADGHVFMTLVFNRGDGTWTWTFRHSGTQAREAFARLKLTRQ